MRTLQPTFGRARKNCAYALLIKRSVCALKLILLHATKPVFSSSIFLLLSIGERERKKEITHTHTSSYVPFSVLHHALDAISEIPTRSALLLVFSTVLGIIKRIFTDRPSQSFFP